LLSGGIAAAGLALVKKAIGDYLDLAKSVQQFGVTAQASAQQASTLIGVARQLSIETSTLDGAFNSLKTAVAAHPEQFAALGIALENADGSARPLIDVFADLRTRLAGATKDAGTLQVAQELLGASYKDLLPLLGLTEQQLAAFEARVIESGGVIDEQGIQKAMEWQVQTRELESTWVSFTNTFGQIVVPGLVNAAQGLGPGLRHVGHGDPRLARECGCVPQRSRWWRHESPRRDRQRDG
jgi:TP901 family phage tail tape measure protein